MRAFFKIRKKMAARMIAQGLTHGGFLATGAATSFSRSGPAKWILGSRTKENLAAKIDVGLDCEELVRTTLRKFGVSDATSQSLDLMGVVAPLAVTQRTFRVAEFLSIAHAKDVVASFSPIFGDTYIPSPLDHLPEEDAKSAGGVLTMRMALNLLNSSATTQQQAALNLALLTFYAENSENPCARLAYEITVEVGKRWLVLPSEVPSLGILSSFGSGTGLAHLFQDVPNAVLKRLRDMLGDGHESKEILLKKIELIGSACELAKQAAIGSLTGTITYIEEAERDLYIFRTERLLPVPMEVFPLNLFKHFSPARFFFQEPAIEGAIKTRDYYLIKEIVRECENRGFNLSKDEVRNALSAGADQVLHQGDRIRKIAESQSEYFANQSIKSSRKEVED
ncbi:hypothetical protein [Xanthomonas melonis]|uniref:hypothetical protein n=1 Tax=Xanthomonas melonis TaxID=56456 RepID=UPI0011B0EB68|nr:hypothetical protein [Xanthomonas melonis]MCC4599982.1 hypothetical protein [Xanthomonas melonis]